MWTHATDCSRLNIARALIRLAGSGGRAACIPSGTCVVVHAQEISSFIIAPVMLWRATVSDQAVAEF